MLASPRLRHGFHGTKDGVCMNLGSFVCMCQKTKLKPTEARKNILIEKVTSPRALGTAGFRGSVMLSGTVSVFLSAWRLMTLSLAVSALMALRQPQQLRVCIPSTSFPSTAPDVLACLSLNFLGSRTSFPNQENGICEWPALGQRLVPEAGSGEASPFQPCEGGGGERTEDISRGKDG